MNDNSFLFWIFVGIAFFVYKIVAGSRPTQTTRRQIPDDYVQDAEQAGIVIPRVPQFGSPGGRTVAPVRQEARLNPSILAQPNPQPQANQQVALDSMAAHAGNTAPDSPQTFPYFQGIVFWQMMEQSPGMKYYLKNKSGN